MININKLSYKRICLLQGPMGPFFYKLAKYLKSRNNQVYKINFNGGDWLFYPNHSINFLSSIKEWPSFLENTLNQLNIDIIILFGDCRLMHLIAREIAHKKGIKIIVFEEGYVRPNYITMEEFGVNNYSSLPRNPDFYLEQPLREIESPQNVTNRFFYGTLWAILYYLSSALLRRWFRHYKHHRPLNLLEIAPWIRSFWRKGMYAVKERGIHAELVSTLSGKYFLVPLQVHNDAQLFYHSQYNSIEQFIREIINSFATCAPLDTYLVIKHHPMDRGYRDYSNMLQSLADSYKVNGRLYYIHDRHLPTLLKHAKGVVLINSTVGLSALYHDVPLKVCGRAVYDMAGLTFTGTLNDFWQQAQSSRSDRKLFEHFYSYLIHQTQLNCSFY